MNKYTSPWSPHRLHCVYSYICLSGRIFTDPVASSTTVFLDVFENRHKDPVVSTRTRIRGKPQQTDRARRKKEKKRKSKGKGKAKVEQKKAQAKNKHTHLYRLVAWGEGASLFIRSMCANSQCRPSVFQPSSYITAPCPPS